MNGSMLDRAASLGTRATADMEIFLLNTVWLPLYNTYVLYVPAPYSHDCIIIYTIAQCVRIIDTLNIRMNNLEGV